MTYCPIHKNEELRREDNYSTGFCLKCLKHYELCCENIYMSICCKLKDHEGKHETDKGLLWEVVDGKEVVKYRKYDIY